MGESSKDRHSSTSDSSEDKQKPHGWIRLHSDESAKATSVDEPQDSASQSPDRKVRKPEKPIA